jgi:hypothetical protein
MKPVQIILSPADAAALGSLFVAVVVAAGGLLISYLRQRRAFVDHETAQLRAADRALHVEQQRLSALIESNIAPPPALPPTQ